MLKIFCCGERLGCHSTCNSGSQLSVDSYGGSEILSSGTGTALNKNNMNSLTRKWLNPNQTLSLKPKRTITNTTIIKGAKIRNRYNQVPHLTKDTNGKVTTHSETPETRAKMLAFSQQVTTMQKLTDVHIGITNTRHKKHK